MLVLTRKVNQQIHLGEDITITVLRVQGNSIRIGVEAPRNVRVLRGELEPHEAAPAGASETAGPSETMEFDLHDLLGEAPAEERTETRDAATCEAATEEAVEPEVYQMRVAAPLASFVRMPMEAISSSVAVR